MWFPGRYRNRYAQLVERRDWSAAAALARRYTKAFPDDLAGWWDLGEAAQRGNDLVTAEEAFRKVIDADADPTPLTEFKLADVLKREDRIAEAEQLLGALIEQVDSFSHFLGHVGLASIAAEQRRWGDARKHIDLAEGQMPEAVRGGQGDLPRSQSTFPEKRDGRNVYSAKGARMTTPGFFSRSPS
jgi:tetratricopeptide (TPR) repeat protein